MSDSKEEHVFDIGCRTGKSEHHRTLAYLLGYSDHELNVDPRTTWPNLLIQVQELKNYHDARERMKPATEKEFTDALTKLKEVMDRAPDSDTSKHWRSDHPSWGILDN